MPSTPPLDHFFAVTVSPHGASLYKVMALPEDKGEPYITKIRLRGASNLRIGTVLSGPMLAIMKGLQFYTPEGGGLLSQMSYTEREIEKVNTAYWKGQTSDIVALFLREGDAERCFSSPNIRPCDPVWIEETKKVLEAIGKNHPNVTICHFPEFALIE